MRVYYDLSETDTELGCQDWPRLVVSLSTCPLRQL